MTTRYVNKSGNDSNAGTSIGAPKLTIGSAITASSGGDTIEITDSSPVTYVEFVNASLPSGSDNSHRTILKATNAGVVTLAPSVGQAPVRVVYIAGQSYISVLNLIIDGTNATNECVKITSSAAHVTIQNNEMFGAPTMGVLVSDASDIQTLNNHIHHGGTSGSFDHAIYYSHDTTGSLIDGNEINNWASFAVHLYTGGVGTVPQNNTVRNNNIHDNGNSNGIGIFAGDNILVYNNITQGVQLRADESLTNTGVYNNTIIGSILNTSGTGTLIKNNLLRPVFADEGAGNLVSNSAGSIVITRTGTGTFFDNLSVGTYIRVGSGGTQEIRKLATITDHNNATVDVAFVNAHSNVTWGDATAINNQGGATLANNIIDPGTVIAFVDESGHNYHLTSSSTSAIDQGVDLSATFTTDKDGVSRSLPFDIGAYEYGTSGPVGRVGASGRGASSSRGISSPRSISSGRTRVL